MIVLYNYKAVIGSVWPASSRDTKITTLFRRLPARVVCGFALLLLSVSLPAAEPVSQSRMSGVAIGGHDTVAYHQLQRTPQEAAVEGVKSYTVEYKGAKWRFLSKQSSELFAADPERYSPTYNGHCANALSLGEGLVRIDGTHWEIFGDSLYLFYAARGRDRWTDGNWQTYKQDADDAWVVLSAD